MRTDSAQELGREWYDLFTRFAGDLYPRRYTPASCQILAEQAIEAKRLAQEKESTIVAHNYLYPEYHELADMVGDSLGLSLAVQQAGAKRVDFESVFFMGATAKIITGDGTRVFVADSPEVLGCSLVFGSDYRWIESWKRHNPDGVLVTYVNSDAYLKSMSDYISTSRNTHKIIGQAARDFPGRKILVLPDKFLGAVMKAKAEREFDVDPDLVEVYTNPFNGFNACCYVHEMIGMNAAEEALDEHPGAELMIHPECGCASVCLLKLDQGIIPAERAFFLSTEGMLTHARESKATKFIVATEKGMIYRLRRQLPEKEFLPVSINAECKYMKANTLDKLLRSLREDRLEIVLCDDCCDPKKPYQDDKVVHIQRSVAAKAKVAIDRMLTIQ